MMRKVRSGGVRGRERQAPGFAGRAWTLGSCLTRGAGVDEDGTVLADLLQINDKFGRVVLCVGENFCAKEGDDMIRDYWDGLVAEVSIVDAQLGVKPVDFVGNEFSGDETLRMGFSIRTEDGGCGFRRNRHRIPWTRPRLEPWPSVLLCL